MVEVATLPKVCFSLVYIFFEVILISRIDGIRNCFEYYISLFIFDVCFHFLHIYVRVLSLWNLVLMIYHCLVLYTFISFFLQVFSWVWLRQVFDKNIDQKVNQTVDNVRSFSTFMAFTNYFNYYSLHTTFYSYTYIHI